MTTNETSTGSFTDERVARLALATIASPGDVAMAARINQDGPIQTWADLATTPAGQRFNLTEAIRQLEQLSLTFAIPGDPSWPRALDDLDHVNSVGGIGGAPIGLWIAGTPTDTTRNTVAIIDARAATSYGTTIAADLAADLTRAGHTVLADDGLGIGEATHRGALAAGQPTIMVAANGADRRGYPAAMTQIRQDIIASGTLFNERAPGSTPSRTAFLARNRLTAALAGSVVVVEAAARSGARNTALWAQLLNRPLMAISGPVSSALSATPHQLIAAGTATLVTNAHDIIDRLRP